MLAWVYQIKCSNFLFLLRFAKSILNIVSLIQNNVLSTQTWAKNGAKKGKYTQKVDQNEIFKGKSLTPLILFLVL